MKDKHILFDELERGEPVDDAHLARCLECRERAEMLGFLRFQIDSSDSVEPPEGFASRVTLIAEGLATPVWEVLERMARTWLPIYALAGIIAILLVPTPLQEPMDELLLELAAVNDSEPEVTLDDLILGLGMAEEEDAREQQD